MNANISEEQARLALSNGEREAKELLKDEKKTDDLLSKARELLAKIKEVPIIGGLVDDITTMIELIGDYVKGTYRQVPVGIIVSALAAIIYLVSPIDLMPDFIPFAGYLDDVIVFSLVLNMVSSDLSDYRNWKEETELNKIIADARGKFFAGDDNLEEVQGKDNG
jgi:uncharacterized membrane protein YkvA (DUF1232 family)